MRGLARLAAAAGVLLLLFGLAWAALTIGSADESTARALVIVANVLTLLSIGAAVLVESRPDGLHLPAGGDRAALPMWAWWWPTALLGATDALAGAFLGRYFVVAGAGLVVVAAAGFALARERADEGLDRPTVRAARWAHAFVAANPGRGPAEGVVEHVSLNRTRLVVVAPNGRYGDVMLPDHGRAILAAELAGVTLADATARELTARITTGPYEWRRMAGVQLGHPPEQVAQA